MTLVAGFVWTPARRAAAIVGGILIVLGLLIFEAVRTRPVRGAVRTFAALITAANTQDLEAARSLCTRRYSKAHALELADEGGIVGLPRNVSKNFQAWQEGSQVLICPTNRVGPVYRFVQEDGCWRFDGPVGLLMPDGRVQPLGEEL